MKYYILVLILCGLTLCADSLSLHKAFAPAIEREYPKLFNEFDTSAVKKVFIGSPTVPSILSVQEVTTDQVRYISQTLDEWLARLQLSYSRGRRFTVETEICNFFADEKLANRYWVLFREKWVTRIDKQVVSWQVSYQIVPLSYKKGSVAKLRTNGIRNRTVIFHHRDKKTHLPNLSSFETDWREQFFTRNRGISIELHEKILKEVLRDIQQRIKG